MTNGKEAGLTVGDVLSAIRASPAKTLYEIAADLGHPPSTVYLRIIKAREMGLLPKSGRHRDFCGLRGKVEK